MSDRNYVRIEGTQEQMYGFGDVAGITVRPKTANELEAGRWEVFAYASDAAITVLEGRGLTVDIQLTADESAAHLAELEGWIGDDSDGTVA